MIKYILTVAVALLMAAGYSQVSNQGKPASWRLSSLPDLNAYVMPQFDLKALQAEDKINDAKQDKPYRFGHEFLVDHTLANSGTWTTLPNGDRIWRMRYYSAGAHTLNFLFTDFYMPKGATLYLYNNQKSDLLGAYDEKQNNKEHVLGTWLVQGSDIWIEYYEPAAVTGQGKLEIFKVVHGYRTVSMLPVDPDGGINNSGKCMYDVDCYVEGINSLKEISQKSVALIIVGNSNWCSGSLINNTNNDGAPYFLTANHCYSDPAEWAFMFNWKSPNPVCAANVNSSNNAPDYHLTVSGSTLKARREESDFMLVEITPQLPQEWGLVWSGWDRSITTPQLTYGIHHPSGDIMKVSVDYDAPFSFDDAAFDGGDIWYIEHWDIGALEPGSSGSPMFDDNGRIRGQAWFINGNPNCFGATVGGQASGYGRLNVSWDKGTTPDTRLKDWLDPGNTGAMVTDFYPPQPIFTIDAQVAFDYLSDGCSTTLAPVLRLVNNGTENLTSGHITYAVNGDEAQVIDWTGNLAQFESELIELNVITNLAGIIDVSAVVTAPNGTDDDNTANNTIATIADIPQVFGTGDLEFNILTDDFASETSWELTNQEGEVLYSIEQSGYASNNAYSQVFALTEPGCYTFAIHDAFSDGICCESGNGHFSIATQNGELIGEGGDYGKDLIITFKLEGTMGTEQPVAAPIAIYPNPSSGLFTIATNTSLTGQEYTVYNMIGQAVKSGQFTEGATLLDLNAAANGIYILKAGNGKGSFKLIKE